MTNTADIARAMAATMESASIPMYGNKLRLPDRGAIIALIRALRRLFFPAYFGDPQLMALSAENYAALLLERIETALTAQIALALPEDETERASQIAQSIVAELPRIQQVLLTDIEATFDGDPAAANKEEIIFAYPGLFAIFVYRIALERLGAGPVRILRDIHKSLSSQPFAPVSCRSHICRNCGCERDELLF